MDDEMYWELLEEQHAHDVVITGAQEGAEDGDNDKVQILATNMQEERKGDGK